MAVAPQKPGRVFDIQRFSTHDGPGIRTTVFLQGCPLRCLWCHNPEGVSPKPGISFRVERCIGCGECVRVCPHQAHEVEPCAAHLGGSNEDRNDFPVSHGQGVAGAESSKPQQSAAWGFEDSAPATQLTEVVSATAAITHHYQRERCEVCGACTQVCPTQGLEVVGREVSVEEVLREVRADRVFYESSGGGLTVSGGEPLLQIEFTTALLAAAKREDLHCCLETSGLASWDRLGRLLPLVDLFLYDFKAADSRWHADFTGQPNEVILENLRTLCAHGAVVQLQCPIIPGFNDTVDHLAAIAALARSLDGVAGVRLLPFHALGQAKWERFGLTPPPNYPAGTVEPAQLASWSNWLRKEGVRVLV